jgi:hypothetical protein
MTTTLTDRYVHATLRSVPDDERTEIGAELRASIADMVDGRVAAGESEVEAERAVLTELGNPDQLATRYSQRPTHLIGPPYFVVWRRLTITLLTWIPAIVALLVVGVELSDGSDAGDVVGGGLSAAWGVAIQIAFWTTLVFAILDWTNTPLTGREWDVDQLPDAPRDREVSLGETATSVGFAVVLAGLIVFQQVRSWFTDETGDRVSILDPGLWSSWIPVILVAIAAGIVIDVVRYRAGGWTVGQAVANVAVNAAFALPVLWLLQRDALFNPVFVDVVGMNTEELGYLTTGTVIGVVVVCGWDVIEAFVKAKQSPSRATGDVEQASGVR